MNCLSNAPSYAASILRRASQILARNPSYGCSVPAWGGHGNGAFQNADIRVVNSGSLFPSYRVQCYSSKSKKTKKNTPSVLQSTAPVPEEASHREKDAFFVVRKGDIVGVYRSFSDCRAQVGSSVMLLLSNRTYMLVFPWLLRLMYAGLFICVFLNLWDCWYEFVGGLSVVMFIDSLSILHFLGVSFHLCGSLIPLTNWSSSSWKSFLIWETRRCIIY